MTTLREEVQKVLGIHIEEGRWEENINRLDETGGFTRRKQMDLIILLLKRVDELEKKP